jgi:hypothetical protein
MDYACAPTEPGRHTVLYGHSGHNGQNAIFDGLLPYQDWQFFEEHRFIRLTLLHEETVWEV